MARWSVALALASVALGAAIACGDDPAGEPTPAPIDAGPPEASSSFCVDGKPSVAYPPGPYVIEPGGTVPKGTTFDSESGPLAFDAFFDPCAPSKVLVIRMGAAFCGTCIWHEEHTKRL